MGTQPQGQGHETTYSQIISHELGVPMEDIVVQHSDTQGTPFGYGSYGSRTSNVGTGAALKAAGKIREKARRYAAHLLEASPEDIEIDGAEVPGQGLARQVKTLQEIAFALDLAFDAPEGMEPYLDETAYHDTPNCTFPFGTHIAIVEVDEETGEVDLVRYVAVDDVGKKINPMIVDGPAPRRHRPGRRPGALGGRRVRRGRAAADRLDARLRRCRGPRGCRRSSSTRPSRRRRSTRSGVKGVGEAGTIASTAAVANAVIDALSPLGIRHLDMPYTPQTVWRAIQVGEGRPGMIPPRSSTTGRPASTTRSRRSRPARCSPVVTASCRS